MLTQTVSRQIVCVQGNPQAVPMFLAKMWIATSSFLCSLQNSTCHASQELPIPNMTVCHVLWYCFLLKPYRIQLLQAAHVNNKKQFYEFNLSKRTENDTCLSCLLFSDETTFHISRRVNHRNVRMLEIRAVTWNCQAYERFSKNLMFSELFF